MKKVLVLSAVVIALFSICSGALAVGWTETFDSYADQTAFEAVWRPTGTLGMLLSQQNYVSPPNSIYQDTLARGSYRQVGADIATTNLYFSFYFYDSAGTSSYARSYGMVYSRTGGTWDGALNQLLAIGKYGSITTTKYCARVAFGGLNWFALDGGPDRSVGWHFAEIAGKADGSVDFRIDGIVGANKPVANVGFNIVAMGSGLTSTHGMWFDDVTVNQVVPEPGSLVVLASSLAGMVGFAARKRRL